MRNRPSRLANTEKCAIDAEPDLDRASRITAPMNYRALLVAAAVGRQGDADRGRRPGRSGKLAQSGALTVIGQDRATAATETTLTRVGGAARLIATGLTRFAWAVARGRARA
jgi:hypothetical protein